MTLPTIDRISSLVSKTGGELLNLPSVASRHQQDVRALARVNASPPGGEVDAIAELPLEAMACGALVCGFDGQGGRDFATADNGLWVAEGDPAGFADALAAGLAIAQAGGAAAQRRIDAGLATAAPY